MRKLMWALNEFFACCILILIIFTIIEAMVRVLAQLNISEQQAAQNLRDSGFKSAFAYDDGISIDSSDAVKLYNAFKLSKLQPKPIKKGLKDADDFDM